MARAGLARKTEAAHADASQPRDPSLQLSLYSQNSPLSWLHTVVFCLVFLTRPLVRIRWFGSPALTATWCEEGLNGNLKDVAAASHAAVFEVRCMTEFNATRGARKPFKKVRTR